MRVSVVIPVYNGAAHLSRCLAALGRSTFQRYECIVVDDGSTDLTGDVACRWGARLVSLPENGGPARARNQGAAIARGELLLFIDADVCVHPDTLERVVAAFARRPELAAVIGSYDDQPGDPSFLSQYKNLFHHYVHQRARAEASTFWSGCGAVRRETFLTMRGFSEAYATASIEDIELGSRLRRAGHRIRLEKSIQVQHWKRWTLASLVQTDLFHRGVPWVALLLRDRRASSDLNLGWENRWGTGLSYALVMVLAQSLWRGAGRASALPLPAWLPAVLLLAILALHQPFYRFFVRARGLPFAAAVIPFHLLYFLYCGAALPLGLWRYLRDAHRTPAAERKSRAGQLPIAEAIWKLTRPAARPPVASAGAGRKETWGRERQTR